MAPEGVKSLGAFSNLLSRGAGVSTNVKIGMSLTSSYPVSQDSAEITANLVEEVRLMAQLGFDSFSLGDHHLTDNHYYHTSTLTPGCMLHIHA